MKGVKQRNPNFELEFGNPKDEEEEALSSQKEPIQPSDVFEELGRYPSGSE